MKPLSTSDTTLRLINAIDVFRSLHFDFPSQYMHTFLTVALHEGITNKDIVERTGLSPAATSRNVKALSPERSDGSPGYNLLDVQPNPDDSRSRVIFLTEHGKELFRKVLMEFGHGKKDPLPEPAEPHSFSSDRKDVPPTHLPSKTTVYQKGQALKED